MLYYANAWNRLVSCHLLLRKHPHDKATSVYTTGVDGHGLKLVMKLGIFFRFLFCAYKIHQKIVVVSAA